MIADLLIKNSFDDMNNPFGPVPEPVPPAPAGPTLPTVQPQIPQPDHTSFNIDRGQRLVLQQALPRLRTSLNDVGPPRTPAESLRDLSAISRGELSPDIAASVTRNISMGQTPFDFSPALQNLQTAIDDGADTFNIAPDQGYQLFFIKKLREQLNDETLLEDLPWHQSQVATPALDNFKHQLDVHIDRLTLQQTPRRFVSDVFSFFSDNRLDPDALETQLITRYNQGEDVSEYADHVRNLAALRLLEAKQAAGENTQPYRAGLISLLNRDPNIQLPEDVQLSEDFAPILQATLAHTGQAPTPNAIAQSLTFLASPEVPAWQKVATVLGVGVGLAGLFSMVFGGNMFVSLALTLLGVGAAIVGTGMSDQLFGALTGGAEAA